MKYEDKIKDILNICEKRRRMGAEQYGEESFYQVENLEELKEELYDVINYATFTILQVDRLQEAWRKLRSSTQKDILNDLIK